MRLLLRSEEHTSELQSLRHLVCGFFLDRKSTRLNSSHLGISYAVFCLKKKIDVVFPVVAPDADCGHARRMRAASGAGEEPRPPPVSRSTSCSRYSRTTRLPAFFNSGGNPENLPFSPPESPTV